MSRRIAVGADALIKIESVDGDVRMAGWDNDEVLLSVDDENNLTLQQDGENITLVCKEDLSIKMPKNTSVKISTINGDTSIRGMEGNIEAETIKGDVAMRNVCKVTIGAVESDFSLRLAKGDVHIKSIGGDASLREVDGNLKLDSVADDLSVRNVGGNLDLNVDADVVVYIDPKPEQKYTVAAGDDILLVLPPQTNATLSLSGDRIDVDWPDVEPEESVSREVVLGDGSARLVLNAGGNVLVTSREDVAESADEFGNFAGIMFDWGNWGRELGEHWGNFGRDIGERISSRAEEAAERVARKAEAAARRAERHLRTTAGRRRAKLTWNWDSKHMPKARRTEPVTDEERMTILRMLAEKKITAEEAEKLLSALEGGQ